MFRGGDFLGRKRMHFIDVSTAGRTQHTQLRIIYFDSDKFPMAGPNFCPILDRGFRQPDILLKDSGRRDLTTSILLLALNLIRIPEGAFPKSSSRIGLNNARVVNARQSCWQSQTCHLSRHICMYLDGRESHSSRAT
jgi:hypothetical protein